MPTEMGIRLTPIQQGMVFHQLVDPRSGTDIEQIEIALAAPVDHVRLEAAWRTVVAAHGALRTRVAEGQQGDYRLVEVPDFRPTLREVEVGSSGAFADWLAADRIQGFDIFAEAPLRVTLLRGPDGASRCLWTFHHILIDGRSFPDVLVDVFDAYDSFAAGREPRVTPRPNAAAFAEWVTGGDAAAAGLYWKRLLSKVEGPTPFPPSTSGGRKRHVERRLDEQTTARLERWAVSLDVSLNSVVQAAWATLLARYTDQETVVFGAARAGRSGHVSGADRMLGVFITTVPMRADVGSRSAIDLVRALRAQQIDARPYEHGSLGGVQSGLFHTLVMYDHEDLDAAVHRMRPAWSDRHFVLHEQTSFPITVYAYARPSLSVKLAFAEAALDAAQAGRALDHLINLLVGMVEDPTCEVRRLPMLVEGERRVLDTAWNQSAKSVDPTTIDDAFRAEVAARPDARALTGAGRTLTFAELAAAADRVTAVLQDRGVHRGAVVGLSLDRSIDMVVAMLGILGAGAAYLPLDPDYPVDRLEFCARDARIPLVVTQRRYAPRFAGTGTRLLLVEDLAAEPATPPRGVDREPGDVAYMIYTSGSTGRPKGVLVTHANVINFFAGMDDVIGAGQDRKWLAVTSTSFDISVLELLWTLTRGFEVVVHGARDLSRREVTSGPAFSLFHFASGMDASDPDPYRLILEAARFADQHGFEAVWSPERHFHDFGAPYPNPSVMSAALATVTSRVQLRAGSVVLPLHDPFRVAEEWALVDRLSHGRIGIAFASGWQPNDFVLAPQNYGRRKDLMFEQIEKVRSLWRGERLTATNPKGDEVQLGTYPRPLQAELPVWITAAGSPDTFRKAGAIGANVLTHMLGQTIDDLAGQISAYRAARAQAGFDPTTGRVSVMVHTFIGDDTDQVREVVRQPMKNYLRSAASLVGTYADAWTAYKRGAGAQVSAGAMSELSAEELEELYEFAFERYFESSGLFGSVAKAATLVEALRRAGTDEIACLIDFGVPAETVIEHLPWIDQLKAFVSRVEQESHDDVVRDIEAHRITHLQCTPSLARMIPMLTRAPESLRTLKQVLVGGESLPLDLVRDLYSLLPEGAEIANMYGPTETTVWSTVDAVPRQADRVTIGRPIANTQCYVVDSWRERVPPGQVGELLIGGDGVALGYHARPELTAERFVDLPVGAVRRRVYATGDLVRYLPDGRLEYLGRRDFQVKVRGHRIELGEVETALRAEPGIKDSVVAARADSIGTQQLVAYLVGERGAEPVVELEALKAALRRRLPDHMVPGTFVWLDALPLTPNGKVDRQALPAPAPAVVPKTGGIQPPRGDAENLIREIWQRVLGVPNIGVRDNFFELGGHSILAVKVQSELSKAFGRRLPIAELFRSPTIETLALHFAQGAAEPAEAVARGADRGRLRRTAATRRAARQGERGGTRG